MYIFCLQTPSGPALSKESGYNLTFFLDFYILLRYNTSLQGGDEQLHNCTATKRNNQVQCTTGATGTMYNVDCTTTDRSALNYPWL